MYPPLLTHLLPPPQSKSMQDVVFMLIQINSMCCQQNPCNSCSFSGGTKALDKIFQLKRKPGVTFIKHSHSQLNFCSSSLLNSGFPFAVHLISARSLWSPPRVQCYLTNQPYQSCESLRAHPNYNLHGSGGADEREGITVQSNTRHWHSASTRPPNPSPRVSRRCGRSWFQVSSFVFLQWRIRIAGRSVLFPSRSLSADEDGSSGSTRQS